MKALVLTKKEHMEIQDRPAALLKNHEIKVKVSYVGVCGTDKHLYKGLPGSGDANMPVVLGHEVSGVIAELGSEVHSTLNVGDRVAIDPNIPCGLCHFCHEGRPQLCENNQAVGVTRDGGMAEFVNVPETNVYPIPDSLSLRAAAMVEPVSCAVHGIHELMIRPHYTACVVGDGFMGQIFTAILASMGLKKVAVSGRNPKKVELLKQIGADDVFNPEKEEHGETYDLVIECVGVTATQERAIALARRGGQVLMFGVADPEASIQINAYDVFFKELTIKGAFINPHAMQDAIQIMTNRIDVETLITHELQLEDIPKILDGTIKEKITKAVARIAQ
ncbi:zinc-dependent alcohol dehydrogenase family protein [Sporolactobacillus inulinus]|jgi:2-desacetyl-2-hydroxyethyl bacteriochlorophyllide A dehydrogenase|uniref:Alcohol dehydrogenase n=1 Tax=Sporolactobacillus inulinus CASD TaxID=1069536 RepID=A0A0U1QS07_9BACL|nr:zinc-dependent alcohol dehydrogenase family protein [Sporolactobacillus inulinus]KLI03587.1 alcohol dehydrogenase [Sporolactobacillus inulinus CASD]GEB76396.1 alcohol dehydrogenase [Sporolactobacillus inulinus]